MATGPVVEKQDGAGGGLWYGGHGRSMFMIIDGRLSWTGL
jgi:hypothetical protein